MEKIMQTLRNVLLLMFLAVGAQAQNANKLFIPGLAGAEGATLNLPIELDNTSTDIVALQFDLSVPVGVLTLNTSAITLSERCDDHTVVASMQGDGMYKVMVYSPTNKPFKANSGAVMDIDAAVGRDLDENVEYPLELSNVVISDSEGRNVLTEAVNGTFQVRLSPDFTVSDITVSPSAVMPGDTLRIAWRVNNVGGKASSGGWSERLALISADGGEVALGTFHNDTPSLAEGGTVSRSIEVALPDLPGIEGGTRVQVAVVPNSDSGEDLSYQKNNVAMTDAMALNIGKCLKVMLPGTVEEGTSSAVRGQLLRSGSWAEAQTFSLVKSAGDERVSVPESVTIPQGQSSVFFYLSVSDNDLLDADSVFTIQASGGGYGAASGILVVEDDEYPQLTLAASKSEIVEGEGFQLTVTAPQPVKHATEVELVAEFPRRFAYPSRVTIPEGETSAVVDVTAIDNEVLELQTGVSFKAVAEKYETAECVILLNDNDLPIIDLELSPSTVAESAGPLAILAKLRRTTNVDKKITVQLSDDSNGSIYYAAPSIVLEAGEAETQFSLGVIDNADAEGNRQVHITAAVYVSSCDCAASGTNVGVVTKVVNIIDDDGPSLGLAASNSTLLEGDEEGIVLTVKRNTGTDGTLDVRLSSDYDEGLSYDHDVTILAGASSVDVQVKALANDVPGDGKVVVFTAETEGFALGTCWMMLTDQTLPDATVSAINVSQPEAKVGESVDLTVDVANIGVAELPELTPISIYIEGFSTPAQTAYLQQALQPGEEATISKTITLPATVGAYNVYAVVNDGQKEKELLYVNNTSGKAVVNIVAPYSVSAEAGKQVYQQGEEVTISGKIEGDVAEGTEVEVYVLNDGYRHTINVKADAQGEFSTTYKPYPEQMGHFVVGACYPSENSTTEQSSFDIYGLKRTSSAPVTCEMIVEEPHNGKLQVVNPGVLPLSGVKATVVSKPENCEVEVACPANVAAGESFEVGYVLTSASASAGNEWEQVKLQIESAEGATLALDLYYYCRNANGKLVADVTAINTTMNIQTGRDYPMVITNVGKGESGEITFALPSWMTTATPSVVPSLACGESATVVLRLKPDEEMQLNVPVTGQIGINCANGEGLPIAFTVEPVSENTGTLVVDVCDEYTYYTDEAPHVSGAEVLVKHPTTGEVVAQGLTDETGQFMTTLPEGYYALSVTADGHDAYQNNVLLDPGRETKKTINLSFQAITIDWNVEETEIEDEYRVETTVKYETNVPMPVVEISAPSSVAAKELRSGESLIFYVTLTNKGLITAKDVEMLLPEGFTSLAFEALDHADAPFDLAPQQSVVVPVKVTKVVQGRTRSVMRDKPIDDDPCVGQVGTLYYWDCGLDRKWHRYGIALQLGSCQSDDPSTWGNGDGSGSGNSGSSYGGGLFGGGGRLSPVPHTGFGEVGYKSSSQLIGISSTDLGCEPCQNQFLVDFFTCVVPKIDDIKEKWDCASGLLNSLKKMGSVPSMDLLSDMNKALAGCDVGFAKDVEELKNLLDLYMKVNTPNSRRDLTMHDILPDYFNEDGTVNKVKVHNDLLDKIQDVLVDKFPDPVLRSLICWVTSGLKICDKEGSTAKLTRADAVSDESGYPSYIIDYQNMLGYMIFDAIAEVSISYEYFGNNKWSYTTHSERATFLDKVNENLDAEGFIVDENVGNLLEVKPEYLSEQDVLLFIDRWNNTIGDVASDNKINFSRILTYFNIHDIVNSRAIEMGYVDFADQYSKETEKLMEQLEQFSNSVCSSITLQFSQTMTMTRQAFRGTLTVFNGNEEKPMEDVRLNLEVRDDEGTLATSHEFQINTESLDGFTGEMNLTDGWNLAANETGTATILFIPTKYAALEADKAYSFGGSLTYVDPFTDLEVTRDLYPVTLTVKPSPELDLTYFMQRDVLGDDPLTADVVEASEPAEFALVINNKGYGDATNVRMVTEQPEIVENEKGLRVDFELTSSQLNGQDATLALGGSIATEFGTIPVHSQAYAQWWLQSSLLGHFTEYDVKATHVTSYGNENLSLLDNVTIHELIHGFTVDGQAEVPVRGFLVNDIVDAEDLPDMVYFTDGRSEESLSLATSAVMRQTSGTEFSVTVSPSAAGWNYGAVNDLTAGKQALVSVVRQSDGKELPLDNFWQTDRTLRDGKDPLYEYRLHFAVEGNKEETYLLTFEPRPDMKLAVESFGGLPEEDVATSQVKIVNVRFNKPIDASTFTADDVTLTCQGRQVDLSSMVISKVSDVEYALGLDEVTVEDGYYVLAVQTAAITDGEGYAGETGKNVSWTQYLDRKVTLTLQASPEYGGTVTPATGRFDYGETVELEAIPAEGYEFAGWMRGGELYSEDESFSYLPLKDEEFTALFTLKQFNVSVSYDETRGVVEGDMNGIYGYGTILTMTAVPFENYVFSGWFMGDEKLSSDDTYSFVVEEDMQVTALFDEDFSTGIDSDARTEAFVIRPLPLHDVMRLDGNFIEIEQLLVYAIDGTVKLAESDVPRGASVDVSSLAKGLYIVKAVTDNGTYVKRVLKK